MATVLLFGSDVKTVFPEETNQRGVDTVMGTSVISEFAIYPLYPKDMISWVRLGNFAHIRQDGQIGVRSESHRWNGLALASGGSHASILTPGI